MFSAWDNLVGLWRHKILITLLTALTYGLLSLQDFLSEAMLKQQASFTIAGLVPYEAQGEFEASDIFNDEFALFPWTIVDAITEQGSNIMLVGISPGLAQSIGVRLSADCLIHGINQPVYAWNHKLLPASEQKMINHPLLRYSGLPYFNITSCDIQRPDNATVLVYKAPPDLKLFSAKHIIEHLQRTEHSFKQMTDRFGNLFVCAAVAVLLLWQVIEWTRRRDEYVLRRKLGYALREFWWMRFLEDIFVLGVAMLILLSMQHFFSNYFYGQTVIILPIKALVLFLGVLVLSPVYMWRHI